MFSPEQLQQLYRYSYTLCGSEQDAYDLLHSALERLLDRSQTREYSPGYCRTTIRNLYIDQCRHQSVVPFQPLPEELPPDINECTLEELVIHQKTLEELWPLFDTSDREILYLWAILGFTAREIAEETNLARGSVLSRIHRIRHKVASVVTADHAGGSTL